MKNRPRITCSQCFRRVLASGWIRDGGMNCASCCGLTVAKLRNVARIVAVTSSTGASK